MTMSEVLCEVVLGYNAERKYENRALLQHYHNVAMTLVVNGQRMVRAMISHTGY